MSDGRQFSLESARAAAQRDQLADWVAAFLASPGSDNPVLAQVLPEEFAWWAGPVQLPIDQLQRLAGPAGDPVLCPVDESYWDDRVDAMDQLAADGWEPPPVIVAYRGERFVVEDGNHRVESLRRAGRQRAWAVVGFERREDCVRFATEWTAASEFPLEPNE
ncbi:MAG: hypothetical protein J2P57_11240 [Acidimicrobiaceae bacterium]|nr:hypothetical protein [Acidimicrobiaceae bacterium]